MGKFQACIAVACVITVAIFCCMCYLMTTVDPPPLERDATHGDKTVYSNVIFDNPPASVGYGLERADLRTMGYPTYRPTQIYPNNNFNVMWQYTPRKLVEMWPTGTDYAEQPARTEPTPELKVLNKTEEVDRETTITYADINMNDTLSLLPLKRSVKDVRNHGNDRNSIILKVLANESNQIVIQIKIGSNDEQEKIISEDKIPERKTKLNMSLKTNNSDELERSELANKTVINILKNESVILKNESVIVHKYDDRISSYSSVKTTTVKINENVTAATTLANQNNSIKNYENSTKTRNVTNTSVRNVTNNISLTTKEIKNDTNYNITVSKQDLIANITKLLENITAVTATNKVIISNTLLQKMKPMQISKPRTNRIEKVSENKLKINTNLTAVKTTVSSTKQTTKTTLLTTAKYMNSTNNNSTTSIR